MKKRKISMLIFLLCILTISGAMSAGAAWQTTTRGRIYTTSKSPGYLVGWNKLAGKQYYFGSDGVVQKKWAKIGNYTYYFGNNGQMRTGWRTIAKKVYYFGTDGAMRTGWQDITVGEKTNRYYFDKDGVMQDGVITVDGSRYLLKDGILQFGFITVEKKTYYAKPRTGILARNEWVDKIYYFQNNCTMAKNKWIYGKWVGSDGRYTGVKNNVGFVKDEGVMVYYDKNCKIVTGWMTLAGKTYYFTPTNGAMKTGWFTVGGATYYATEKGVIQKSKWVGKKYLQQNGSMAKGWQTIGSDRYYFKQNGERAEGARKIDGKTYLFSDKGVLQKSQWITIGGKKFYAKADGTRATGLTKIGKRYYYLSVEDGRLLYKWIVATNGKRYYAHKTKGYVFRNKWFSKMGYKYYALGDCSLATGLKVIGGKKYFFTERGRMTLKKKITTGGATYYFGKDGFAVSKKWVKIDGKYYYFMDDGKMAKNGIVAGYIVGPDGARGKKVTVTGGWVTANGKKYYYVDGKATIGWKTINSNKYYFDSTGAMTTGIAKVGTKKYYFFPTGIMAADMTIGVGEKEYTINASGVVTAEKTIVISGDTLGSRIAKYAIKFIGNPYVYGGTSLTNGADCSGFVYSIHQHFGINLLRVADDQMKGPDSYYQSQGYKRAVTVSTNDMLPGDLIFYGYGDYASHVALYIGNGQIVHASNSLPYPQGGIKKDNYDYSTPLRVVRYWS